MDRQVPHAGEFVAIYPYRGLVPPDLWSELAARCQGSIDILVYAGQFLWDGGPALPTVLANKADVGVRVRLALGDPDSEMVRQRGDEEGIGDGLASRIRISLAYLHETTQARGIEVRLHSTPLYASIYRFDDDMLINTHIYGAGAPKAPVIRYRRLAGGWVFRQYEASFEKVWASAAPYVPGG